MVVRFLSSSTPLILVRCGIQTLGWISRAFGEGKKPSRLSPDVNKIAYIVQRNRAGFLRRINTKRGSRCVARDGAIPPERLLESYAPVQIGSELAKRFGAMPRSRSVPTNVRLFSWHYD